MGLLDAEMAQPEPLRVITHLLQFQTVSLQELNQYRRHKMATFAQASNDSVDQINKLADKIAEIPD